MTNETVPLEITDLVPQNATFNLSTVLDGDKPRELTLKRWSLLARQHVLKKYGAKAVKLAFESVEIGIISEVAWYLLLDKDKEFFKGQDDFLDNVVSIEDQINLIKAVVKTMGIGEPQIKKLTDAMNKKPETADPNAQAPTETTTATPPNQP